MQNIETIPRKEFVYGNSGELLDILSAKFETLINSVHNLYKANEEMFEFDPKDYDLIQARQENLEIINNKIVELKKIQEDIKKVCPYHPLVDVNIYDEFLNDKENQEKKEGGVMPSISERTEEEKEEENKKEEESKNEATDVITEIEL